MAGRKTKTPKSSSSETRAFAVVLEEIRAQNKGFGEGLQLVREGVQALRQEMVARFDGVDRRFEAVGRRFDRVESDIADIRQDVGLVKIAVLEHSRGLKEIRVGLEKIVQDVIARGR